MKRYRPSAIDAMVASSRLIPPDRVVITAWSLLKLAALRADLRLARRPRGTPDRTALLALRVADWAQFLAFPAVARRSGRAEVVAGLTLGQALVTAESIRRGRALDPAMARDLAPQLAWLAYASVVPLIVARGR